MTGPKIHINGQEEHIEAPGEANSNIRKTLHQNIFGKLRPIPLLYHWTVWFDKHSDPLPSSIQGPQQPQYTSRLTILYEDISDIANFYRVYNNYPWDKIRLRDTVHIFRQGVKPVWEDPENSEGGCWTFRVPKAKGQEFFHEIVLLAMGNELQAAVESEHDHILGISTSVRFNSHLVSVWNKYGSNERSIRILERTIFERLSPELRPPVTTNNSDDKQASSTSSYFYKRHADHEGYREAMEKHKNKTDI